MTNPFAAVISDLRWLISIHETADFAPIVGIEAVIRLLEAAGGVDKARLVSLINGSELRHALMGGGAADPQMYAIDRDAESELRALLAALPDEVK